MSKSIQIYAVKPAVGKYYIGQAVTPERRLTEHRLGCGALYRSFMSHLKFCIVKNIMSIGIRGCALKTAAEASLGSLTELKRFLTHLFLMGNPWLWATTISKILELMDAQLIKTDRAS